MRESRVSGEVCGTSRIRRTRELLTPVSPPLVRSCSGCSSDFKMFIWSLCFSDLPPVSPIYVSLSLMRVCLYLALCPLLSLYHGFRLRLSLKRLWPLYLPPCLAPVPMWHCLHLLSLCITVSPGGGLCNWADTRTRTDTHPQPCRWRLNLGSKRPLRPAVLLVPEAGAARAE